VLCEVAADVIDYSPSVGNCEVSVDYESFFLGSAIPPPDLVMPPSLPESPNILEYAVTFKIP
jgi:hypothetical protein